jgi:membrane protein involved in colicin uptake
MNDDEKAAAKAKADEEAKLKAEAEAAAKKKADDEKAAAKAKARRTEFHVVGPGSVHFGGKLYKANDVIGLTPEEAAEMGELVAEGRPKPPPAAIAQRKAGKYKVAGPGTVWFSGKPREKGFALDLDEAEARSLGAAVVEAGE